LIRSRISSLTRRGRRLLGFGLPSRHRNDYATHVPVLVGIGAAMRIERILEFGSGVYSTLTFLNRVAFPRVSQLDSVESDPEWMSRVLLSAKGDPRLRMRLVPEPMESTLTETRLESYDLILVDSSTDAARRASLIRELARRHDFGALVAIHDFEISLYRAATKSFRNVIEYTAYNPCTGILWHTDAGSTTGILKRLSKLISRNSRRLQPDDVQAWSRVFREDHLLSATVN
jgi:predicted O-methyltransferase YrrM